MNDDGWSVMKNSNKLSESYLTLDWADKPDNVHAYSTLTSGGVSTGDYAELNLATHVGDELAAVTANRKKLKAELNLPAEPVWLEQVHGDTVIVADEYTGEMGQPASETSSIHASSTQAALTSIPRADASVSRTTGAVCVALTADCLPVFFCNMAGTEVAVAHAGWRGLHAGVIRSTINTMHSPAEDLLVSLGPAIGVQAFEVGSDVRQAFVEKNSRYLSAFTPLDAAVGGDHYLCDIYQLARIELVLSGVNSARIAGGQYCTFSEKDRFYSYRRDKNTGRMANLIWLT